MSEQPADPGPTDDGALADDPTNDADGRGAESTMTEEGTTFEPEEDPEGAAE